MLSPSQREDFNRRGLLRLPGAIPRPRPALARHPAAGVRGIHRLASGHPVGRDAAGGDQLGRGAEFGMVPLGDGRVYWYGAVNAPPGHRSPDELATVRERFGSWHEPIPALLDATATEAVLRNDIYHLGTPLSTYVTGRVALVGDAAHAMIPNLGQGACQAIEDAVVLGAICANSTDLVAALAAYDQQRRPRTQRMARDAYRIGRFGQQLANPVAVAARKHDAAPAAGAGGSAGGGPLRRLAAAGSAHASRASSAGRSPQWIMPSRRVVRVSAT